MTVQGNAAAIGFVLVLLSALVLRCIFELFEDSP